LKAKQDGIRHSIQRKIGLGPDYSEKDFRGSVSARSHQSKEHRDSSRFIKDLSLLSTSSRSLLSPTSRSDRSKDFILTPRNKAQVTPRNVTLKKITGGSRLINPILNHNHKSLFSSEK